MATANAPAHCLARSTGLTDSSARRAAATVVNRLEEAEHGAVMPVGTRCANVAILKLDRHLVWTLVQRLLHRIGKWNQQW